MPSLGHCHCQCFQLATRTTPKVQSIWFIATFGQKHSKRFIFSTEWREVSSKHRKEFLSYVIIWFLISWCCWLSVWSLDELATDDWEVKEEKEGFSGQGEVAPAQETFQQVAFFSIALLLPVHNSAVRWASRWMEVMDWWLRNWWHELNRRYIYAVSDWIHTVTAIPNYLSIAFVKI